MTERIRALQMHDGNRRWWTLGAMCFALFMIMLDNTVVNVALPSIQRSLHASTVVAGVDRQRLHAVLRRAARHRRSPRRPLRPPPHLPRPASSSSASASAAIGFSPSDTWLVAWRAVQGVGAALMMPATLSIITNAFPPERARQGDRHVGRRLARWRSRSAPSSAAFSSRASAGSRSSSSTCPSPSAPSSSTLFAVRESRDETVERTRRRPRRAHADGRPRRARARARRGQRTGAGARRASSRCSRSPSSA